MLIHTKRAASAALLVLLLSAFAVAQISDRTATGSFTSAATVVYVPLEGRAGASFTLTGTWTATVVAKVIGDGSGSASTTAKTVNVIAADTGTISSSVSANGTYIISNTAGMSGVLVTASVYTSGTVNVALRATTAASTPGLSAPVTGTVTANQGTAGATGWPVVVQSGTALPITLPILCPTGYTHYQNSTALSGTTVTSVATTPGTGQTVYVKSMQISNTGSTFAGVDFYTSGTGTIMTEIPAPATGGAISPMDGILQTTTTARSLDAGATASSSTIRISIQACVGP